MKNIGFMQGRLVPPEKNLIQSFPIKKWRDEFKIASKLKLTLMEWTIDKKNFYNNPINNQKGINKIKILKKKYKIKIESITCDFFMHAPYFKKNNEKTFKMLQDLISNAGKLNIKYLVIPLVDYGSLKNKYYEKIFINKTLKLKKILDKNKVRIIFESDYSPNKLLDFINKFPKKNFGINYDLGNSAGLNYKLKNELIYFHRVLNIHLKDKDNKNVSVELGTGRSNFKDLFNYCKKIKYKGNYIFQTARSNNDIDVMKKNIKFIKKFL